MWRSPEDIEAIPPPEIDGYPEQHWLVGPLDGPATGGTFIECVQTIHPIDGLARPVVGGTVIPCKVPEMYYRPWARIWEKYHEKGTQRPPEKPVITFDEATRDEMAASTSMNSRAASGRTR